MADEAAAAWTNLDELSDRELLIEMGDVADQVAHLAHRLDDLATRIDRVIGAAGRRWSPEAFDTLDAEEAAFYAAQACHGVGAS